MVTSNISSVSVSGITYHPVQGDASKGLCTKLSEKIHSLAINLSRPYWHSRELTLGSLVLPLSQKAHTQWSSYLGELASRICKVVLGVPLFVASLVPALISVVIHPLSRVLSKTDYIHTQESNNAHSPISNKFMYQNVCMRPGEAPLASVALPNINHRILLLAESIKNNNPDVAAFSEMGPHAARELFSKLKGNYTDFFYDAGGKSGLCIISRSKIASHLYVPFKGIEITNGSTGFFILETAKEVLCVSHLIHDTSASDLQSQFSARDKQLSQIKEALNSYSASKKPIYLLGDLGIKNNTPDLGRRLEYLNKLINSGFTDKYNPTNAAGHSEDAATVWNTSHLYSHGKAMPIAITDYILEYNAATSQLSCVEKTKDLNTRDIRKVISNHEALIATTGIPSSPNLAAAAAEETTTPSTPDSDGNASGIHEILTRSYADVVRGSVSGNSAEKAPRSSLEESAVLVSSAILTSSYYFVENES